MNPDSKLILVVTVLAVILAGIFVYLFFIDRKIRKVERQLEKEHADKLESSEY